ncbi:MAG: CBS domain-containing protein, partial [Ottowia sp.]|nr:CBS domain-containing protein [Ottowia sp.]
LGLTHAFVPDVEPVPADTPITELYRLMVAQPAPLPVVAEDGRFVGTVSKNRLLTFLDPYTDADGNPLPEAAVAAEAA